MYTDVLDAYSPDSSGEILYEALTAEDDLLRDLKHIETVVLQVLCSRAQLFSAVVHKRSEVAFQATPLGKQLLVVLKRGEAEFSCYFPLYKLNPYVGLLFKCAERFASPWLFSSASNIFPGEVQQAVVLMNDFVAEIRQEAADVEFDRGVKGFVKSERKRAESLDQYIDALFEKHSRMVVIRLDLAYETGFFSDRKDLLSHLGQVKADWAKLQRDLHQGIPIPGLLGFACKLEYGHLKGFHFHLLLFYNGADYREDVTLARLVGEYWWRDVTKGKGRYYNCNKNKANYLFPGIGIIKWNDAVLVSNLKAYVAPYLVKTDYWLMFSSECGRSFFRGNMPKLVGVKRGRPRFLTN